MSLETPNSLAAFLVFFYAAEGELPPGNDNPEQIVITAAEGIKSLQVIGEPPTIEDGFFVELLNPITPDIGTYFLTGYEEAMSLETTGFTPFPVEFGGAPVSVAAQSQSVGNFLLAEAEPEEDFGLVQLAMWTTPPTENELPVTLPIPS